MKNSMPIHLLIRYSDRLFKVENSMVEHSQVVEQKGIVWFGKIGKPLGKSNIMAINAQCNNSIPTYLYLVQKNKKEYITYKGTVVDVSRIYPSDEKEFIPQYYFERDLVEFIQLWIKLSALSMVDRTVLNHLKSSQFCYFGT